MIKSSHHGFDTTMLVSNLLICRIFTQFPMALIKSLGSGTPLFVLSGGAIWSFVIFLIAVSLFRYANGNIIDAVQDSFGAVGKIIVSVILAIYLLLSQIFTLNDFSRLAQLICFPTSPLWFVAGFLALGSILGATGRQHSVIRLHGVFMPIIIIVLALLIGSTVFPFDNAHSVAAPPLRLTPSFKDILAQASLYGDILLLFLISPSKNSKPQAVKAAVHGSIFALIITTLFFLAFATRIPQSIVQNGQFPIYLLMKEVYFGRFFQRLDAMILLISAISSMLYLSLNLNLLSSLLHQGLGLPETRITPTISGILSFCLALCEWIFQKLSPLDLLSVLSLGVLVILIICAIFVKVRRVLHEKS